MSLLNSPGLGLGGLGDRIAQPLSQNVDNPFDGPDFESFLIEELEGPKKLVKLFGNQLPFAPFKYGGSQRVKKDYYPGNSEPATQVLGPMESDQIIRGVWKDDRLPGGNIFGTAPDLRGASLELQELIDSIRIRGNLCRFRLGEWQRYGFIEETIFDMRKISRIAWELKLSIVGFNAPRNAKFLEQRREVPFKINEKLVLDAAAFAANASLFPATVPLSIADAINGIIGDIAGAFSILTDFVDGILTVVQDIGKAVERAKGLIKHAVNKLQEYKRTLGALFSNPFNTSSSLTGVYANSSYFSAQTTAASVLTSTLAGFRDQFNEVIPTLPLGRHLVKTGDTLQKIAVKFYDSDADWKRIFDYNNLTSTVLTQGTLLEIPRV